MKKYLIAFVALLAITQVAKAELRIDITEGTFKPVPIAITTFDGGGDSQLQKIGQDITNVVMNDLQGCGLFQIVDSNAYIQSSRDVMSSPRFPDWKLINAEALVGGLLRRNGSQFQVDFRLFDVFTESQLTGLSLGSNAENWRRVAHQIADAIYERVTGDKGYFDTRIVYIAESGKELKDHRKYRLAIQDYDGANHAFLSAGNSMVLTPRFSHDRSKFAYLDFGKKNKAPNLHIFNLANGQSESLGAIQGLKMTPRFSPDGSHLILSIADKGVTSLYRMDLGSKKLTRLTTSAGAIDVSPCYDPDGKRIVYSSDRGGKPQLYVTSAGGGEGTRISFGKGAYHNPVWSPRGDLIAFTKQDGIFYIGVMRPDGSGERMIAQGYLLEGPSWSPNGREIIYTCQKGPHSEVGLQRVDIVGFNKVDVPTPQGASYPTW
jgi:TolB protein